MLGEGWNEKSVCVVGGEEEGHTHIHAHKHHITEAKNENSTCGVMHAAAMAFINPGWCLRGLLKGLYNLVKMFMRSDLLYAVYYDIMLARNI